MSGKGYVVPDKAPVREGGNQGGTAEVFSSLTVFLSGIFCLFLEVYVMYCLRWRKPMDEIE